jgi:hypothetical protein
MDSIAENPKLAGHTMLLMSSSNVADVQNSTPLAILPYTASP